jgi:Tfp pilus assembly protein PilO
MNIEWPSSLRDLPPATQRAAAVVLGALALGLLVIFLAVMPKQKQIQALATETEELNQTLSRMRAEIATTDALKKQCAAAKAELDQLLAAGVIEPLLGSFAMRGKSLLDPVAQEAGFSLENVKELPLIPLQTPSVPPQQTYGRQPVEFTGQGSYQQIADFISKAEAAHPMITLSSLVILAQQQNPESHRAIIVFEWPAKGEKHESKQAKALKP